MKDIETVVDCECWGYHFQIVEVEARGAVHHELLVDGEPRDFACGGSWWLMPVNHHFDRLFEGAEFDSELYHQLQAEWRGDAPLALGFSGFTMGSNSGGGQWIAYDHRGELVVERKAITRDYGHGSAPIDGPTRDEWRHTLARFNGRIKWIPENNMPRDLQDLRRRLR